MQQILFGTLRCIVELPAGQRSSMGQLSEAVRISNYQPSTAPGAHVSGKHTHYL